MLDPEQEAFRQGLRLRIRPQTDPPDDWEPRRRVPERKKSGPPRGENPSPNTLAVHRYRERLKLRQRAVEAGLRRDEPCSALETGRHDTFHTGDYCDLCGVRMFGP